MQLARSRSPSMTSRYIYASLGHVDRNVIIVTHGSTLRSISLAGHTYKAHASRRAHVERAAGGGGGGGGRGGGGRRGRLFRRARASTHARKIRMAR